MHVRGVAHVEVDMHVGVDVHMMSYYANAWEMSRTQT